ncbi:MAG: SOS response-associated peptidase family protein [Burkholderiales bacterium]
MLHYKTPRDAFPTMCSNYRPVTRIDHLLTFFGVERDSKEAPPDLDMWPLGLAPFIRLHEDGSGNKVIDDGRFGLLPAFTKELAFGRKTYNARSETVATKPSFRDSWKRGQRCIVPAEWVYEPCYESGVAVRTRVQKGDASPMGIAGIYSQWTSPEGAKSWSFAMLTVNAAGHPIYERLHAPGDEKRMVVILEPGDYDRWLKCSVEEATTFFKQWTGPLEMFADAAAARRPKPPKPPKPEAPPPAPKPGTGDLFS